MRAPSMMSYATTCAFAVFAALGTERALAARISARYAYGWLAGGAVITCVALAGGFTAFAMKYPDASVLGALHAPGFPVRRVALFDPASPVKGVNATTLPAALALSVHVDPYEPGYVALTPSEPAPKGSALVASENYYPGWRATIDGGPVVAERHDCVQTGVALLVEEPVS